MQTGNAVKLTDASFLPIIESCEGCERVVETNGNTKTCGVYVNPGAKWRLGICNLATHIKPEVKTVKVRINPLKASKRASRRK